MPQIEPHWTCLHACSACAGDYEDPERTASSSLRTEVIEEETDDEERAEKVLPSAVREEFPVREE